MFVAVAGFGVSPVSVLVVEYITAKGNGKKERGASDNKKHSDASFLESCLHSAAAVAPFPRPALRNDPMRRMAHDEVVTAKQPRQEALVIGRASSTSLGFYV